MEGDNTNQGIVWCVSVMVIATYLSYDSTIVKGIDWFGLIHYSAFSAAKAM